MGKILINSVYVGDYGYDRNNLPHEMINFFRDDNDKFFIYVTPYGTVDSELTLNDIDTVLFVQSVKNTSGMVEVLAKAVIKHDDNCKLFTEGINLTKKGAKFKSEEEKDKYLAGIEEEPIYASKKLSEIHASNKVDNDIHVTMRVSEICLPKTTFYLTTNEENLHKRANVYFVTDQKKIANQSMKAYYDNFETKDSGGNSFDVINNQILWKDANETPRCDSLTIGNNVSSQKNFFSITRQQDNEVMFSNMLYYAFTEYPLIINEFYEKVLKIDKDDNIIVEREKDRMDIRLIGEKSYVIIENKINSPINGMFLERDDIKNHCQKNYTYQDGYRASDGKYVSQLCKYYGLAEEYNKKTQKKRHIKGFVLKPNYIEIDRDFLDKYAEGGNYSPLNYSNVKEFFEKYLKDNKLDDIYLLQFIKAMEKHSEDTDCEYRKVLLERLYERINK